MKLDRKEMLRRLDAAHTVRTYGDPNGSTLFGDAAEHIRDLYDRIHDLNERLLEARADAR